jgi:hypothetical protein
MLVLIQRLIRLLAFIFVAIVGVCMAIVFVASTIVAVVILVVVARLRGRSFSVKEYWMARSARRQPILKKDSFSKTKPADVTDVNARDIS